MTNEETVAEVIRLIKLSELDHKKYADDLKLYVETSIKEQGKIITDQINSVIKHAEFLDEKFTKYTNGVVDKLTESDTKNQQRSDEIVFTNKLIAAASLSNHYSDPISQLNKLIKELK